MNWLRILAPVLIYLSCTLSGAFLGYRYAERSGLLALEQLRRDHADAERNQALLAAASAKAAAKKLLDEQAHNDKLAADLAEQKRTHRKTTDRLTGEIARVNDLYLKELDAEPEPLPACVFTVGWVRVYDEGTGAIAAGMPPATDTGRAAAQSTEGRAAEQLDSGISQRDLLEHHTRYAEQCRNTAAQLDLLIDAVQGKYK